MSFIKLKNLSLRFQMLLVVVGIPLIFLGLASFIVGQQYRQAYREAYLGKGELIAIQLEQTIETVAPYVATLEDATGLSVLLKQITDDVPEFDFIALVDDNGKVLEHSNTGVKGSYVSQLTELDIGRPVRRTFSNGVLYLISRSMPLPGEEDRTLYIVVGERSDIVDRPFLSWLPAILGIVVALIMIVVLRAALNQLILQPLHRLAEGAAIIGAGDLAYKISLDQGSGNELGFVARSFNEMSRRLQDLVTGLEERVRERTAALERKSRQLEAVSAVSTEAAQARNVSVLLNTAVDAVSQKFGFYHTGIFIIDDSKEWAIMRAASSDGGQRMLARGHRLPVEPMSIVGYVAGTGQPRIAFDVGEDAVWFNTPELPATRSEMALPMKVESEVIGVLDVQSEDVEAFTDEDISTLQLMADQLAIALYNARLLEGMEGALDELRELQASHSDRGWARVAARLRPLAYEYDRVDVSPVPPLPVPAELREGLVSHKIIMDGGVPVMMEAMRVRDEVVGYMGLADPHRVWTEEEIALVESVSEQVALALENARLFEEAQRTAGQQVLISRVLQVAASSNVEADQMLAEIARVLSYGLDMAIAIFTFPVPDVPLVHSHVALDPSGQHLPFFEEDFRLSREHAIFFSGLTHPELGPLAPLLSSIHWDELDVESRHLVDTYDLDRVLYVPLSSAGVLSGFIAMIQRRDDPPLDPDTRELAQNIASQIAVVIENLSLEAESRRRSAELQSLYQISLRFSEKYEPSVVLRTIIDEALTLFEVGDTALFLYDAESGTLRLTVDTGAMVNRLGFRMELGEGLMGDVLRTRSPRYLNGLDQMEADLPEMLMDERFDSVMAVPLSGRFGPLGVLLLYAGSARSNFEDDDVRLAELFAAQAAAALENARLNEETKRRAEELGQLYDVGLDLSAILDVQQLLDRATDRARELFAAPSAIVILKSKEMGEIQMGQSAERPEFKASRVTPNSPRPGGLTDYMMSSRQGILIPDNREAEFDSAKNWAEIGLLSQMAAPLRVGRENLGAIFILAEDARYFSERDLELLEFLATQVALAIQNATQFGQTQMALSVVERQARYQANISEAVALLAESGTGALGDMVRLLGEAADVNLVSYAQTFEDEEGPFWRLMAGWTASDAELEATTPPEFIIRASEIPGFAERLRQEGVVRLPVGEFHQLMHPDLAAKDITSVVALAVHREETLPGFITFVSWKRASELSTDELAALQTASAALSNTLARERLFAQVEDALEETETLYQASAQISASNSFGSVLDVLRRYSIFGRGSNDITIQLFDKPWTEDQVPDYALVAARWSVLPQEALPDRYAIANFPSAGSLVVNQAATFLEDLVSDPRIGENLRTLFMRVFNGKSVAILSLTVGGQLIGFLNAIYPETTHFSEEDKRRLVSLAQQAAIVIQNINQLQSIEARARRERMIREISEKIQAAPDVQSVLQTAVRELGQAFGTPRNLIQFRRPAGLSGDGGEEEPS